MQAPKWFHYKGGDLSIGKRGGQTVLIASITGGSAELTIRHHTGDVWTVAWKISQNEEDYRAGQLRLTSEELEEAFGGTTYLADYTIHKPGLFIRQGEYLNIPNPGTGMDGDANISVLLTDSMYDAIKQAIRIVEAS